MKRIYIGIVIFLLVGLLTWYSGARLDRTLDDLQQGLQETQTLYSRGAYLQTEARLQRLCLYYEQEQRFLSLILKEEHLEEFSRILKGLPAYNTAGSPVDFYNGVLVLQEQLGILRSSFFSLP